MKEVERRARGDGSGSTTRSGVCVMSGSILYTSTVMVISYVVLAVSSQRVRALVTNLRFPNTRRLRRPCGNRCLCCHICSCCRSSTETVHIRLRSLRQFGISFGRLPWLCSGLPIRSRILWVNIWASSDSAQAYRRPSTRPRSKSVCPGT